MLEDLVPKLYLRLRERRKMTQEAFAELIGKSRWTVSSWERAETRPSYDDERRLFESCGCSWQEALEIMSEVLSELSGRPVSLGFEDRDQFDHPQHPLTRAEHLLRLYGRALPERLQKALLSLLLKARANAALVERDNADALETIEACLAHATFGAGMEAFTSTDTEDTEDTEREEDKKRWTIFPKR